MSQTIYKINTDIVSSTMKDKPLIFISEEAINLKRDNDNLKSIIKEVREYINAIDIYTPAGVGKFSSTGYGRKILEILDKVEENK